MRAQARASPHAAWSPGAAGGGSVPPVATVHFTPQLARHQPCPDCQVPSGSLREALDAAFSEHPKLRGYVLDDQGQLRKHVVVFVDGEQVADRSGLSDPVAAGSQVYVMQALSGG